MLALICRWKAPRTLRATPWPTAKQLALQGIRVNGAHPTVTPTPMAGNAWSDPAKAAGLMTHIPAGRFAESSDIAEVILFLLSDEAAMVNGISMPVDGGFMIA